jgi:hypothetical protein
MMSDGSATTNRLRFFSSIRSVRRSDCRTLSLPTANFTAECYCDVCCRGGVARVVEEVALSHPFLISSREATLQRHKEERRMNSKEHSL